MHIGVTAIEAPPPTVSSLMNKAPAEQSLLLYGDEVAVTSCNHTAVVRIRLLSEAGFGEGQESTLFAHSVEEFVQPLEVWFHERLNTK